MVSVIMACHNAGPYVQEAIQSALDQTYKDLEVIFVDDHSHDDSLTIANSLADRDKRLKIYSTLKQSGPACARNLAIEKATGAWIAVLDADDVFENEKIEKQVEFINSATSNLVLIGTNVRAISEDGGALSIHKYPAESKQLKANLVQLKKFPLHSSLMYRSSALQKLGGFNNRFQRSQDFDLWLRLYSEGDFHCLDECLLRYRHHHANISNSMSGGFSQIDYSIAAKVCFLLRQEGLADPSSVGDDNLWETFMRHIAAEVRAAGVHDYLHWRSELRYSLSDSQPLVNNFIMLKNIITHPQFAWGLLSEQMFGSDLPQKCMKSWLMSKK